MGKIYDNEKICCLCKNEVDICKPHNQVISCKGKSLVKSVLCDECMKFEFNFELAYRHNEKILEMM